VPYPIALAMLVAITDLIPLVGATIGAIVCTIVAFFASRTAGFVCLGYFVAYQQVENYVIVPKVMKRTVDVSPLATIVAALVGGTLLGIVGALLAIPVAAAIQLVGTEVVYPRQDAQ
jgi:predicted PurR-regulated permease PerM